MRSRSVVRLIIPFMAYWVFQSRSPAPPVQEADIIAAGLSFVRLPDGRLMEYKVCGDDAGTPLLTFPGFGTTALSLCSPDFDRLGKKHGLRIISVTLPGFGLSDSLPVGHVRTVGTIPADVAVILEKEKVKDFYVTGLSFGGMHAAAVASAFTSRVLGVVLASPTCPFAVEKEIGVDMPLVLRTFKTAMKTPYVGDVIARLFVKIEGVNRLASVPELVRGLQKWMREGREQEAKEFIADNERSSVHTFRGWTDNMATIDGVWDFDLSAIGEVTKKGRKVLVLSSPDDSVNPPPMQRWVAEAIPGAELRMVGEGSGHFFLAMPHIWDATYESLTSNK